MAGEEGVRIRGIDGISCFSNPRSLLDSVSENTRVSTRYRLRPVLTCVALALLATPALAQDPGADQGPVPTFAAEGVTPTPRPVANRATAPALQPLTVPNHLAVNPVPSGGYAR